MNLLNTANWVPSTGLGAVPVYAEFFNELMKNALNMTQDTLTGAGAVSTDTRITWLVTTGADALTLADGYEGQEKFIIMKTDGGDGTLTPANLGNGSTLTFDNNDTAHLLFTNGSWYYMGGNATLA